MLRFWISPNAADYYRSRGIGYGLHQVLRVLDDPLSMTNPLGFLSERDVVVGHLMQVVHANPVYDLELLESTTVGSSWCCSCARWSQDGIRGRRASGPSWKRPTTTPACWTTPCAGGRTPRPSRCVKTCCSPRTGLRWTRPLAACPRRSRTCVRCPPPGAVPRHLLTVGPPGLPHSGRPDLLLGSGAVEQSILLSLYRSVFRSRPSRRVMAGRSPFVSSMARSSSLRSTDSCAERLKPSPVEVSTCAVAEGDEAKRARSEHARTFRKVGEFPYVAWP